VFSEKKKQKTLASCGWHLVPVNEPMPAETRKSFLLPFFKKEVLLS
jgi:hypothetical protein